MRVAVWVAGGAVAFGACAPFNHAEKPITVARSGVDGTKLASMLRGSVTNGGLWFDDADCAATFQTPGEVKQDQLSAFGQCLATLKLQASARKDALLDVAVMHYAPGFEVQARIVEEKGGPHLTWIGFAARRTPDEPATITVDAFESLRIAGDRNGPPAPQLASVLDSKRPEYTWLKVCLDVDGNMTSVDTHASTSLEATKAFRDAVSRWRFKPFTIAGQPVPVCAMVRPTYAVADAPPEESLPMPLPPPIGGKVPIVLTAEGRTVRGIKRTRGSNMIAPNDRDKARIAKAGSPRLNGSFYLCIDATGAVASVARIKSTGLATYDTKIQREMEQWAFEPLTVDGTATPLCTALTFIYTQR